jgi:DNA invertase Pin-like site-specific DNA recombinase
MVSHGGFIAYYRVSTGKQAKSGLGIEAQRQAVATYLNGGNWRIIAEFTEIESGKRSDRPALDKALAAARVRQVPLVVAKVDRLKGKEIFAASMFRREKTRCDRCTGTSMSAQSRRSSTNLPPLMAHRRPALPE